GGCVGFFVGAALGGGRFFRRRGFGGRRRGGALPRRYRRVFRVAGARELSRLGRGPLLLARLLFRLPLELSELFGKLRLGHQERLGQALPEDVQPVVRNAQHVERRLARLLGFGEIVRRLQRVGGRER